MWNATYAVHNDNAKRVPLKMFRKCGSSISDKGSLGYMQQEFPFNISLLTLPKHIFTSSSLIFCLFFTVYGLCLSLQVAHLPADPHPGPDHLPAGLSGAGQAVSLAANNVSLIYAL